MDDNQKTTNDTPPAPSAPAPQHSQPSETSMVRQLEKASAWTLILSAILFAVIAIMSVWGGFGDSSDAAWKASASLGIIALAALVVNVGARIFEGKDK